MITRRLAILFVVLCGGLSCVGFVPKVQFSQPEGIVLALPETIGEWVGKETPVSDYEREALGPETEFARKLYRDAAGNEIFVSLVLAGRDMNTSIHRPERCLPSQGATVTNSRVAAVSLGTPDALRVTRLQYERGARLRNGKMFPLYCLDYYWFVGCNETTPSHTARMLIDIRDRLLKGYNQRWGYITVTAAITGGLKPGGLTEEETDALIGAFIRQLAPKVQKPGLRLG